VVADESADAHPERGHRRYLRAERCDHCSDRRNDVAWLPRRQSDRVGCEHARAKVGRDAEHFVAGELEADEVPGFGDDVEQSRWAAGPAVDALADLDEKARLDKGSAQAGERTGRKLESPRDLGARDGAVDEYLESNEVGWS
jgi:hypothetical protein